MGKGTKIEWAHHTFNPWWGCTKVSDGCKNCYAEAWAKRTGHDIWGADKPRRFFGDEHWRGPEKWDEEAHKQGERKRVFCASMADVFEKRPDLIAPRARLFTLIEDTPDLDWLLLTKRPEDILELAPRLPIPKNIWLGTSAENQEQWDIRLPHLMEIDATIHFVSAEPLLGPIYMGDHKPEWMIVGGESGPRTRRIEEVWAQDIQTQCAARGTKFFFKQWGGRDKEAAGRMLNGRTYDELPFAA